MKTTTRLALVFATAAALFVAAGVVAYAIPNCWEICDGGGCWLTCYYDGGCAGYTEVCISGQGYCQFTCANGAVYNSICHRTCSGGGGSPVFKKPDIEELPNP